MDIAALAQFSISPKKIAYLNAGLALSQEDQLRPMYSWLVNNTLQYICSQSDPTPAKASPV